MPSAAKMYLPGVGSLNLYDANGDVFMLPGDSIEDKHRKFCEENGIIDSSPYRDDEDVAEDILKVVQELSIDNNVEVYFNEYKYYSIVVYGGANGTGKWSNYYNSLSLLMKALESTFEDAWVMEQISDPPDDLFSVKIGVRLC